MMLKASIDLLKGFASGSVVLILLYLPLSILEGNLSSLEVIGIDVFIYILSTIKIYSWSRKENRKYFFWGYSSMPIVIISLIIFYWFCRVIWRVFTRKPILGFSNTGS
ncbi:hypothetical protein BMS3Abin16_01071 [archaeon BMS3Abin16]|nr:hypothetical protein BMS3Abin16_01071 [archaeon BMS3Abin16]